MLKTALDTVGCMYEVVSTSSVRRSHTDAGEILTRSGEEYGHLTGPSGGISTFRMSKSNLCGRDTYKNLKERIRCLTGPSEGISIFRML
jgi:hypothetical protein